MGGTVKQKLLFAAAIYLYFTLRVSGFIPITFNFTTRKFESSYFATIYSALVLVWLTFFSPQIVEDFYARFHDQFNNARSPVDRGVYKIFTSVVIVANLMQIYHRTRLKNLLNWMIDVAGRVENTCQCSRVNIHRWVLLNLVQTCILHLAYLIVFVNFPAYLDDGSQENRLKGLLAIMPGAFFLLLANGVTNVLSVLIYLFMKINGCTRGNQEQLQVLTNTHSELCQIVKTTVQLASHLLLSALLWFFCVIIIEAYLIYENLAGTLLLGNSFSANRVIEAAIDFFVFLTLLLIQVIVYSKCNDEMQRTPQLIVEAFNQSDDVHEKIIVEACLLRCSVYWTSDFMVYNMLAINFNLVYEMLGAIASYVIVMVQFHISYDAVE